MNAFRRPNCKTGVGADPSATDSPALARRNVQAPVSLSGKHSVPILVSLTDDSPCRAFVLTDLPVLIGRSRESAIRIDELAVDGQHCAIYRDGDEVVVKDSQTWGGTYVNGERIVQRCLQVGDRLQIGNRAFLVSCLGRTSAGRNRLTENDAGDTRCERNRHSTATSCATA